jgi:hypothetical protein
MQIEKYYFNFILFLIKYVYEPICSCLLVYQFIRLHTKRVSFERTNAETRDQIPSYLRINR